MSGPSSNLTAQIPAPSAPLVDEGGRISLPWRAWFLVLQRRTGGTIGASPADAIDSVQAETAARIAADNTLQSHITAEQTARAAGDAALLPKAGGTLTGPLTGTTGTFTSLAAATLATGAATWTSGAWAPTHVAPIGSLFSRTNGGLGGRLFVSGGGGAWSAVSGV